MSELKRYFTYKTRYENKQSEKTKGKCIGCNQDVGTIFGYEDNTYFARCGSKEEPCALDIRIQRGEYIDVYELKKETLNSINRLKEEIIRLKLDVLFGFMKEETMIEIFQEKKEEIAQLEDKLEYYQNEIENNLQSEAKEVEIKGLEARRSIALQEIKEEYKNYKRTDNKQYMSSILSIYIEQLLVIQEELRNTKYEEYIVEEDGNEKKLKRQETNILNHVVEISPMVVESFKLKNKN